MSCRGEKRWRNRYSSRQLQKARKKGHLADTTSRRRCLATAALIGLGAVAVSLPQVFHRVVRAFLGDLDVVGVALDHGCRRDAAEPCPGAELVDGAAAGVAHGRAEAADELVGELGE